MKFQHTQTRDDGGGHLSITAETPAEVLEVLQHFRVFDKDESSDVIAMAKVLAAGPPYTYESKPTKRLWFKCESALDYEFTQPYEDLLRKITGFDGQMLLDMDLTEFHPRRLCHTHITDSIRLEHGHITYVGYDEAEDWNNRTAAENADLNCADYIAEDFGFRRHEREYIEGGNGQMKRNPNYMKRYKAQPGLGATWFWKLIFDWWRANHASLEQLEILKACERLKHNWNSGKDWDLRESGAEQCSLIGSSLYYQDPNGKVDWTGNGQMASVISWDGFAKLADTKERIAQ